MADQTPTVLRYCTFASYWHAWYSCENFSSDKTVDWILNFSPRFQMRLNVFYAKVQRELAGEQGRGPTRARPIYSMCSQL